MTNYEPVQSASIKLFNSLIEFHKGATYKPKPEEIAKIKANFMFWNSNFIHIQQMT